jgi:hypothetical protein
MADQTSPQPLADADLDGSQGAGVAVGNPGSAKKGRFVDLQGMDGVKPEDKKLFGDDLGIL